MLTIGAVNLRRLTPKFGSAPWRAVVWLKRNALSEATIGAAALAMVGALRILPPASHSQPQWPFPFRVDLPALTPGRASLVTVLATLLCGCAAAAAGEAAAGRPRRMAALAGGRVVCLGAAWIPLRSPGEDPYPTSFYPPAEPYSAPSIVRGAAL